MYNHLINNKDKLQKKKKKKNTLGVLLLSGQVGSRKKQFWEMREKGSRRNITLTFNFSTLCRKMDIILSNRLVVYLLIGSHLPTLLQSIDAVPTGSFTFAFFIQRALFICLLSQTLALVHFWATSTHLLRKVNPRKIGSVFCVALVRYLGFDFYRGPISGSSSF